MWRIIILSRSEPSGFRRPDKKGPGCILQQTRFITMCTCTGERSAALPLCHVVGHDGFSGQQVRVFNVADHLCGGFGAQLQGVDVNRGKLRSCQLCKDGVIEGDDGKLLRDLNPISVQRRSSQVARISSLTMMPVGRSGLFKRASS